MNEINFLLIGFKFGGKLFALNHNGWADVVKLSVVDSTSSDEFLKQNIIFSMLDNARFGKHSIALLTKLE